MSLTLKEKVFERIQRFLDGDPQRDITTATNLALADGLAEVAAFGYTVEQQADLARVFNEVGAEMIRMDREFDTTVRHLHLVHSAA